MSHKIAAQQAALNFASLHVHVPARAIIADIKSSLKEYTFFIGFCVFTFALTFILYGVFDFIGQADGNFFGIFFITLLMFTAMASIALLAAWHSTAIALRMAAFAQANKFNYHKKIDTPHLPGLLFNTGDDRSFNNVISGSHNGHAFSMGNSVYTTGSGKNRSKNTRGVVQVQLKRRLPHVMLDAKKNNFFGITNLPQAFSRKQKLQLEGDFNKHFDLYVPEGYDRDALYFLTPELMALLIDFGSNYDIEVVDDHLFIYKFDAFNFNETQMREIFTLIEMIGGEMHENTEMYADARVGSRAANAVAYEGQRLKKGVSIITIIIVVYFVVKILFDFVLPLIIFKN